VVADPVHLDASGFCVLHQHVLSCAAAFAVTLDSVGSTPAPAAVGRRPPAMPSQRDSLTVTSPLPACLAASPAVHHVCQVPLPPAGATGAGHLPFLCGHCPGVCPRVSEAPSLPPSLLTLPPSFLCHTFLEALCPLYSQHCCHSSVSTVYCIWWPAACMAPLFWPSVNHQLMLVVCQVIPAHTPFDQENPTPVPGVSSPHGVTPRLMFLSTDVLQHKAAATAATVAPWLVIFCRTCRGYRTLCCF
jgi:hypothetical protein